MLIRLFNRLFHLFVIAVTYGTTFYPGDFLGALYKYECRYDKVDWTADNSMLVFLRDSSSPEQLSREMMEVRTSLLAPSEIEEINLCDTVFFVKCAPATLGWTECIVYRDSMISYFNSSCCPSRSTVGKQALETDIEFILRNPSGALRLNPKEKDHSDALFMIITMVKKDGGYDISDVKYRIPEAFFFMNNEETRRAFNLTEEEIIQMIIDN